MRHAPTEEMPRKTLLCQREREYLADLRANAIREIGTKPDQIALVNYSARVSELI